VWFYAGFCFRQHLIVTMCILFVYINNSITSLDEYQVIIALNRDEFIDRPTLPAHFWNDHCIGG